MKINKTTKSGINEIAENLITLLIFTFDANNPITTAGVVIKLIGFVSKANI